MCGDGIARPPLRQGSGGILIWLGQRGSVGAKVTWSSTSMALAARMTGLAPLGLLRSSSSTGEKRVECGFWGLIV